MNDKICFVIMPFSKTSEKHTEEYWTIFFSVIQHEMKELGYKCERSETGPYNMLRQIIEKIDESDLVVAVLTDLNPNVWYELGIRHSLKCGTIMLIEDSQKIPFDVTAYGLIKYSDGIGLSASLRHEFTSYVQKLTSKKHCDSPVLDTVEIPSRFKSKLDSLFDLVLKISEEKNVKIEPLITPKGVHSRILWIDDYPSNNASIMYVFEGKIHFDIAINTSQGLQYLENNDYDLIITDMGRGDEPDAGLKLIREIKENYPECKTPIAVFASSRALGTYGNEALKLGAIIATNMTGSMIALISETIAKAI